MLMLLQAELRVVSCSVEESENSTLLNLGPTTSDLEFNFNLDSVMTNQNVGRRRRGRKN